MKNTTTIKTIAKELNISVSTVSRSLSNNPRIGLKTKERVIALARKLNYVPNMASNYLKTSKTFTLGLIVPYLGEEYFSQAISGIEDVIEMDDYHIQVFQSRNSMEREILGTEMLLKMRVDGVIASISAQTNSYMHFKKLEDYGIPIIFFDRIPRNFPCHSIYCDLSKGAAMGMHLLYEKNIKNVCIINGPNNLEGSDQRLDAYLEGVNKYGFTSSPKLIKSCDLTPEGVENCIDELFSQSIQPEAIITFNDYVALYAMRSCKKYKLETNREILFLGFGNLPFTKFIDNPPFASIEQFPELTGKMSARLLLDIINDKHEISNYKNLIIDSTLVIH